MKTIKVTIRTPAFFGREYVMEIRETKTGYPYLRDYRALKAALSAGFVRCKVEEVDDGRTA